MPPKKRSLTSQHHRAINELVQLEERNALGQLSDSERGRWRTLTYRLFGQRNSERRKFFRVRTNQSADFHLGSAAFRDVEVTSMGAGGLFLHVDEPPSNDTVGQHGPLYLRLPAGDDRGLDVSVRVKWISPAGSEMPGIGVEFVELDDQRRTLLLGYLRSQLLWQLELSREKYAYFFQHSADLAFLLDPDCMIRDVNNAGLKLLGHPAEELSGMALTQLLSAEEHASLKKAIERVLGHEEVRLCVHLRAANDESIPMDVTITPFHVQDLEVGAIFVGQDLRLQRQVEEKQRALERRLFQSDKLATIGQITAGIAHDINNPLTYILSNMLTLDEYLQPMLSLIDHARHGDTPAAIDRTTLDTIRINLTEVIKDSLEGAQRIADILKELRHFSMLDDREERPIDINQTLDACVRVVKNLIKHRARLERDYAPNLPPVYGNVGRVSQMFINLLTNATQAFGRPDLQRNVIQLRTRVDKHNVTVEISDNGRGIPAEVWALIFEPFFSTRRDEGGTGLGLAIARESAESLGGHLSVRSEQGQGSCFIVTVPLQSRPTGPRRLDDKPNPGRRTGLRLLVIDDEPALLRGLKRLLARDYEVSAEKSPIKALQLPDLASFDIVLCDVMMPEMSGIDFREELIKRKLKLAERLVFMTGGTFTHEEHQRLHAQSNPTIQKPLNMRELKSLLDGMAEKS